MQNKNMFSAYITLIILINCIMHHKLNISKQNNNNDANIRAYKIKYMGKSAQKSCRDKSGQELKCTTQHKTRKRTSEKFFFVVAVVVLFNLLFL